MYKSATQRLLNRFYFAWFIKKYTQERLGNKVATWLEKQTQAIVMINFCIQQAAGGF
jgi:hypothetical protein